MRVQSGNRVEMGGNRVKVGIAGLQKVALTSHHNSHSEATATAS